MSSFDPAAPRRAADALPSIPRDTQGPVFREPWEAHAFALALALHDKGLFAWTEWAAMLGEEIKKARATGDPDTGATYYRHWMATLERMVAVGRELKDRDGAQAVIMGCAGMARHRLALEDALGIPVIDPTQAAVTMALGVVQIARP